MLKILSKTIVILIILSLCLVGIATAQTPAPGSGPDFAMAPTGEWRQISSGEYQWYSFYFDYDEKAVMDPIEIRIYANPTDGATLTIRNEQQAEVWRQKGEQEHFGCCTLVDEDKNNDGKPDYALWRGSLRASGRYYIVVEHAKNLTAPVMYRFTMTGSGLSFPGVTAQPAAAPAQSAAPATAQEPKAPTGKEGTGPDYAMQPTGEWMTVKSGEYQWYAFYFDYDEDKVSKPIEIRFYSQPFDGATLTVRNAQQAEIWRQKGEQEHFGCCTLVDEDRDNDGRPDYALWAGSLRSSGLYYIVVEHAKNINQPVTYRFTISGERLSFPGVPAQPAAAPAAPPVIPAKPVTPAGLDGTGPDYAMKPVSEWRQIKSGEYHWYAFKFAYDEKKANEPIEIRMYTEPRDGATLTVRNTQQADIWRKEGKQEHFGCCTLVDEDKDGDGKPDYALWKGQLTVSGTYYIVVEHARNLNDPVQYLFTINGQGVSF